MNYKKFIPSSIIAAIVLLVIALLTQHSVTPSVSVSSRGLIVGRPSVEKINDALEAPSVQSGQGAQTETVTISEKKVVRTASLQLVIESASWAASTIRDVAEKRNGFIESSNVTDNGDAGKKAYVIIRIPVAKFSETLEAIKSIARVVEIETIQGRDVTQEFIDLGAHLKNLQASEAQYLEIMKKAQSVDDILKVQERLTQVQGEIESLQGQIKYLNSQSDFATITVNLSEEPSVSISLKDFRPSLVMRAAVGSLLRALVVLFNLLVQAIILGIPLALLALIIAWLLFKIFVSINHKWR